MNQLSKEDCHLYFEYDDGNLVRKIYTSSRAKIGDIVGCMCSGRLMVSIGGKKFAVGKIVFMMHKGYWPELLDHEDRNPFNNKINNLRDASRTENNRNRTKAKNKTSVYNGVSKNANKFKMWSANIVVFKKRISIGSFYNEEEAALVYNKYAVKHFGDFANINIIKKLI